MSAADLDNMASDQKLELHTISLNATLQWAFNESSISPEATESEFWLNNDLTNVQLLMQTYIPPILIAIGTVGNVLIILATRRKHVCNLSICFYLCMYAVSNLLLLYLTSAIEWISVISGTRYIADITDWGCRLWQFILRLVSYFGIWLVVAMSIDQYIAVWHPYRAVYMCTVFMAKFAIVIIIVGLVVISVHAMWIYQLMQNGCYILHNQGDLNAVLWPWLSGSLYSFVPLSLLFIFDVLLLAGLCVKKPWQLKPSSRGYFPVDLTVMTFTVSLLYFLFTTPATIINVIDFNLPPSWLQDTELMTILDRARLISHFLPWLNPSILFLVCVVCSRTIRGELVGLLRPVWCIKRVTKVYELHVTSDSGALQVEVDPSSHSTPV
jgi:hypothetical protein